MHSMMCYELDKGLLAWPLFRKPERLQVFLYLVLSADGTGSVSATDLSRLPVLTGLSDVTVSRSISDLEAYGIVSEGGAVVNRLPVGMRMCGADGDAASRVDCDVVPTPAEFVKPTREDVAAYIRMKSYSFTVDEFFSHYDRVGWVVGKNKKQMKSWKGACSTFQRNQKTRTDARKNNYTKQRDEARSLYVAAEAVAQGAGDIIGSIPDI